MVYQPPFQVPEEVIIDSLTGYAVNVPLGYQGYPGWQIDNPDVIQRIYELRKAEKIIVTDDYFVEPETGEFTDALKDQTERMGATDKYEAARERVRRDYSRSADHKRRTVQAAQKALDDIERFIEFKMASPKKRVMHVRTQKGVEKYGLPIGAVIVADSELTNIREVTSKFEGFTRYRGAGRNYWLSEENGTWYVTDDEDYVEHEAASEADALEWMDEDARYEKASPDRGKRPIPPGYHKPTADELLNLRIKGKKLPPAWVDVCVSDDPDAALRAFGYDQKDRKQYLYSEAHTAAASAAKYKRNETLAKNIKKLDDALTKDWKTDPKAAALLLIRRQGMRPGSTGETHAKVQAFGATTLQARHVKVNQASVTFDFIGKDGVQIHLVSNDPDVIAVVKKYKYGKKNTDPLFPGVSDASIRPYLKQYCGDDVTPKDLRTLKANEVALVVVKSIKTKPKTEKDFIKAWQSVGEAVASVLGNKRDECLKSYINPTVFSDLSSADPQWLADATAKMMKK